MQNIVMMKVTVREVMYETSHEQRDGSENWVIESIENLLQDMGVDLCWRKGQDPRIDEGINQIAQALGGKNKTGFQDDIESQYWIWDCEKGTLIAQEMPDDGVDGAVLSVKFTNLSRGEIRFE